MEITTPSPTVDMDRLRSQIDGWLNRYLLIGVGHLDMAGIINTGMQLLHDNGLVLPAEFQISEQSRLQFRFEVFNLPNTPSFAAPNSTLDTGTVGSQ